MTSFYIGGILGLVVFVLSVIGYWRLIRAFYEMRQLLRQINESLQTHTRLLAAMANAVDPEQ